ncbi:hypothetical protein MTO96_031778, partial [Rhipicephalus appendiculatus]
MVIASLTRSQAAMKSGRGRGARNPPWPPQHQQQPDGIGDPLPAAVPSCSQYELAWSSCVLRRKNPRNGNRCGRRHQGAPAGYAVHAAARRHAQN